jgi:hypothetical protein
MYQVNNSHWKISFNSLKKHLKGLVLSLLTTHVRKGIGKSIMNSSLNLFLQNFLNILAINENLSVEFDDESTLPNRIGKEIHGVDLIKKFSLIRKIKVKLERERNVHQFFMIINYILINFCSVEEINLDLGRNYIPYLSIFILLKGLNFKNNLLKLKLSLKLDTLPYFILSKLSDSISKQTQLQSLKLFFPYSKFGDSILSNLSKGFYKLISLRKCILNFDGNQFKFCKTIEDFAESIQFLTNLETFYLSLKDNYIGNREIRSLAKCLISMTKIKRLNINLQNNNLTDYEALILRDCLKNLSSLIDLKIFMENNSIQEICNNSLDMKAILNN